MMLFLKNARDQSDAFLLSIGRTPWAECMSFGVTLIIGADLRIGGPGEIAPAVFRLELHLAPWRHWITRRQGWFAWQRHPLRRWDFYKLHGSLHLGWPQIARRRRALFGSCFA